MTPTPITITHLGAETCVTGSCHLVRFQPDQGGRIVNYRNNDLFFVGFQAKDTPGRDIMEGRTPAKAAIHRLFGYSAHADQQTLCDWVKVMPVPKPNDHVSFWESSDIDMVGKIGQSSTCFPEDDEDYSKW